MLSRTVSSKKLIIAGVLGVVSLVALVAVVGVFVWSNRPLKVDRYSLPKSEIAQALGVTEGEVGDITPEVFERFVQAKKSEKFAGSEAQERKDSIAKAIASVNYPGHFVQGIVGPDGGVVENAVMKLVFPAGALTQDALITFRTKPIQKTDSQILQLNQSFSLLAESLSGEEITKFSKDIQVVTKNVYNASLATKEAFRTFYFNEDLKSWEAVRSSVVGRDVVALTNHFSTYTTSTEAPADPTPEEEEYLYADCGVLVDDSFMIDEDPDDDIDRTNCFDMSGLWKVQQVGVLKTSLYSNEYLAVANWYGDYENISGQTEVFAVLPDVAELRGGVVTNPETGGEEELEPGEYATAARYYIYHDEGIEEVEVERNMEEEVPNVVSLGTYNFNSTEARVFLWGLTSEEANAGKFIVADAICFGECPEGIGDVTPPEIKNAKAVNQGNSFLIQAEITDSQSGVGNVYLSFNGQLWPMQNNGNGVYSVVVPSLEGINLNYFIIAYDKAGNEAIWNPILGYVSRGAGLNIGVPPEAARFVNFKQDYYKRVLPAKAGLSACNQCAGDPVNTQNGNLLEQLELASVAGRPDIDFNIQYNSLGGTVGIFGENWTHSYNYKLLEFDNADYQGVYVTYPGGNTQGFKREGDVFIADNPFLEDEVRREGEALVLVLKDQTKVYFDAFGDAARVVNLAQEELTFSYDSQEANINFSHLTEIRAEGGRSLRFEYNDKGLVAKVILPDNREIVLSYSADNDLISVVNENGSETKFDYADHVIVKKYSPEGHTYYENTVDSQRRITRQVAGDDFVQNYEYLDGKTVVTDGRGTVAEYKFTGGLMQGNTDEVGSSTKFEYDANRRIVAEVDPEGNRTEYSYDERGNQTEVRHADGTVTKREFNERNQLTRLEDKSPEHVTSYEYDERGNLTKLTNALNEATTYRYNSENELIELTDARGFTQRFVYNAQGDLTSTTDKTGATTRFEYDAQGRRLAEIDALGRRTTFAYDATGNLTRVERPLNAVETYEYDKNNRLIKAVDAEGRVTAFAYDVNENLIESTNPLGNKKSFTYGEMNELLRETNEEGITTTYAYTPDYQVKKIVSAAGTNAAAETRYTYNQYNAPVTITDPEGRISTYTYDSQRRLTKEAQDTTGRNAATRYTYNTRGVVTSETDAEGRTTKYELDKLDRVTKVTNPEGGTTSFTYDATGNRLSETDPNGNTTRFEYDGNGRLIKATNASGNSATYRYDAIGNLLEQVNFKGVATAYEYDALNRLVREVRNPQNILAAAFSNSSEVNITTTYEYDRVGNMLKQTNPRGFATSFAYDALNRVTEITDSLGSKTSFAYNKLGSLTQITDRNGNTTKKNYDALQRVVEEINAKNHSVKVAYDKVGNTVQVLDAKGNPTRYSYNGLNQLTESLDALGGTTRYNHDRVGNTLKVLDANGHATTYTYDKLNRLVAETNPEEHKVVNAYDANSNPVKRIDAKGQETSYNYDSLNRLVQEVNAMGGEKRYSYDQMGNLLSLRDANSHTDTYQYDVLDRLISETDAEGNTTTSLYDQNGNVTRVMDANGNATNFDYDALDRLTKEVNALGEAKAYEYDRETNITGEIAPDGVKTAYNYDPIYLLSRVTLNAKGEGQGGDSQTNVDTNYKYDPNGNLTRITDPKGGSTNFAYDALNRQVRETNAIGNTWSFGYDAVGNRTSRVDANGQATAYAYYPDNMLKAISYAGKYSVGYAYDANNNEVSVSDNLGVTTKTYDALNRETNVKDALDRTLAYQYDNESNVTKITYPGGKTVSYGYLKNDWMREMRDPAGLVTTYNYDHVGNNTEIRNPNNTLTVSKYDKVNRVVSIQNMNLSNVTNSSFYYSYDNVGQRTKVEKAYGWQQPSEVVDTYQYDPIRRLVSSNSASSKGNVTNAYGYDRNSNRVSWTSSDNESTPRPFDKAELEYTYNAVNQLLKVTEKGYNPTPKEVLGASTSSSSSSTSSAASSKAAKPQTKTTYKTVTKTKPVVVSSFIDGLTSFQKELEVQKDKGITPSAYQDLTDQVKNLLKKAEAGTLTRTQAETLVEKLRQSIEDYTTSKDIKNNGIRTSLLTKLDKVNVAVLPVSLPTYTEQVPVTTPVPGSSSSATSKPGNAGNAPGQVKGEVSRDPKTVKEVIFQYDANGNRISKLVDGPQGPEDQLTLYSYDPENRLTQVLNRQRGNSANSWIDRDVTTMKYDALGRRLVKTFDPKAALDSEGVALDGKKRTEYLYNYRDPVAEFDMLNSKVTDLYRGVGNRISAAVSGSQTNYLHYDALNSVVGITNEQGSNNKNIRYHDFGKIDDNNTQRSDSTGGTTTDPHGHYTYTGQEWDEHAEIYEFYSRAYDPVFGVWLRQDDYRASIYQSIKQNRYLYAGNNPVNFYDIHGYDWFEDWKNDLGMRLNIAGQDIQRTWNDAISGQTFSRIGDRMGTLLSDPLGGFVKGTIGTGVRFVGGFIGLGLLAGDLGCGAVGIDPGFFAEHRQHWDNTFRNVMSSLDIDPDRQQNRLLCSLFEGMCNTVQDILGDEENISSAQIVYDVENALLELAAVKQIVKGVSKLLSSGGDDAAKVVSSTADDVSKVQPNRLNHIFNKTEHALEPLVAKFGSQEKAFSAVQDAANIALKSGKIQPDAAGLLPKVGEVLDVDGIAVRLIGGRVENGTVIISSFSRKGL